LGRKAREGLYVYVMLLLICQHCIYGKQLISLPDKALHTENRCTYVAMVWRKPSISLRMWGLMYTGRSLLDGDSVSGGILFNADLRPNRRQLKHFTEFK